ncbi:uncharacterized protein LOC122308908 [Carya illinoinensis]|uniref:uncharacterized protein LOC122308908 n=1 Tax=Carya illinoinensis TaxID=32201 RepID=UPI001C7250F2|nr:uncharacterized protein LOC122308908 [Carya illinoinensis]
MDSSSSNSEYNLSAREQDEIDYDYTAVFIKIINKLVKVLLNLLQVMYSSNSSLNMVNVIIIIVFIPISFAYMAVTEVITQVPNTRYRHVIGPVIYVLGILTCVLLLLIIYLSQA